MNKRVLTAGVGLFFYGLLVYGLWAGINEVTDLLKENRLTQEAQVTAEREKLDSIETLLVSQDTKIRNLSLLINDLGGGETECLTSYLPFGSQVFMIPPPDHVPPPFEAQVMYLCGVGMKYHSSSQGLIKNPKMTEMN